MTITSTDALLPVTGAAYIEIKSKLLTAGYDQAIRNTARHGEAVHMGGIALVWDLEAEPAPVDLLLFCPACGEQHIDAPAAPDAYCLSLPTGECVSTDARCPHQPNPTPGWTNPPHKSHECQFCKHTWRPSDVPTNGVAEIHSRGKVDGSPEPIRKEKTTEILCPTCHKHYTWKQPFTTFGLWTIEWACPQGHRFNIHPTYTDMSTVDGKAPSVKSNDKTDLLYRLARHLRNTENIPPTKWGVDGMNLLAELRALDEAQYDLLVKPPPGAAEEITMFNEFRPGKEARTEE